MTDAPERIAAHIALRAGKPAMQYVSPKGHLNGKLFGHRYITHRIIWKLVNGFDPNIIDHINKVKSDNRLCNLRDCTVMENSRNCDRHPGKTSVFRGVSWVKRDMKFVASISNGKGGKISLGHHDCEIEAAKAYDAAAKDIHGEFAVLNFPSAQTLAALGLDAGEGRT